MYVSRASFSGSQRYPTCTSQFQQLKRYWRSYPFSRRSSFVSPSFVFSLNTVPGRSSAYAPSVLRRGSAVSSTPGPRMSTDSPQHRQ